MPGVIPIASREQSLAVVQMTRRKGWPGLTGPSDRGPLRRHRLPSWAVSRPWQTTWPSGKPRAPHQLNQPGLLLYGSDQACGPERSCRAKIKLLERDTNIELDVAEFADGARHARSLVHQLSSEVRTLLSTPVPTDISAAASRRAHVVIPGGHGGSHSG